MGCKVHAICPNCGNENFWRGREAATNEKSVVVNGFYMVDTDIVCGKCKKYFWLSSARLIWRGWV